MVLGVVVEGAWRGVDGGFVVAGGEEKFEGAAGDGEARGDA